MTDKLTHPEGAREIAVSRVECVSYENGYRESAEPIWRIEVDGYCADFPSEAAVNNFLAAITKALASPPAPQDRLSLADVAARVRDIWSQVDLSTHDGAITGRQLKRLLSDIETTPEAPQDRSGDGR